MAPQSLAQTFFFLLHTPHLLATDTDTAERNLHLPPTRHLHPLGRRPARVRRPQVQPGGIRGRAGESVFTLRRGARGRGGRGRGGREEGARADGGGVGHYGHYAADAGAEGEGAQMVEAAVALLVLGWRCMIVYL